MHKRFHRNTVDLIGKEKNLPNDRISRQQLTDLHGSFRFPVLVLFYNKVTKAEGCGGC